MNGAFAKNNLSDAPRMVFVKQNEPILNRKGQSAEENSIRYPQKLVDESSSQHRGSVSINSVVIKCSFSRFEKSKVMGL